MQDYKFFFATSAFIFEFLCTKRIGTESAVTPGSLRNDASKVPSSAYQLELCCASDSSLSSCDLTESSGDDDLDNGSQSDGSQHRSNQILCNDQNESARPSPPAGAVKQLFEEQDVQRIISKLIETKRDSPDFVPLVRHLKTLSRAQSKHRPHTEHGSSRREYYWNRLCTFWWKQTNNHNDRKIIYKCRSDAAKKRPRKSGRFVQKIPTASSSNNKKKSIGYTTAPSSNNKKKSIGYTTAPSSNNKKQSTGRIRKPKKKKGAHANSHDAFSLLL